MYLIMYNTNVANLILFSLYCRRVYIARKIFFCIYKHFHKLYKRKLLFNIHKCVLFNFYHRHLLFLYIHICGLNFYPEYFTRIYSVALFSLYKPPRNSGEFVQPCKSTYNSPSVCPTT